MFGSLKRLKRAEAGGLKVYRRGATGVNGLLLVLPRDSDIFPSGPKDE